jgi:5'-nucleotidase
MRDKEFTVGWDMDGTLCDFDLEMKRQKERNPEVEFPQSKEGFFMNLPAIQGAVRCFQKLKEVRHIQLYILTAPSIKNALCYTEKRLWVEQWLGMDVVEHLIIANDKSLVMLDVLVDDNVSGKGQDRILGKLIHVNRFTTHWDDLYEEIVAMSNEEAPVDLQDPLH